MQHSSANVGVSSSPDFLLSGERQRQVDAVQGHPVDVTLPIEPLPEREGVAVHAHVLKNENFDQA